MKKTGDWCYGARVAGDMVTNITVACNKTPLVIVTSDECQATRAPVDRAANITATRTRTPSVRLTNVMMTGQKN